MHIQKYQINQPLYNCASHVAVQCNNTDPFEAAKNIFYRLWYNYVIES
jgi:hypothetical protein